MFSEQEHRPPVESKFDFREELRRWAPRMAILALPFSCGEGERQELGGAVSNLHEDRHAPVAVLEGKDDSTLSDDMKIILDRASREPSEDRSLLAVALPEGDAAASESAELFQMLEQHSSEARMHVHLDGKSHDRGNHPDAPGFSLRANAQPHAHASGDASQPHMLGSHAHVEGAVSSEGLDSVHSHAGLEHGGHHGQHGEFEVFKGAEVVGNYGEAIREILELDGHVEFPVVTPEGTLTVGFEKRAQEISGRDEAHAELRANARIDLDSLTPDSPAYGYVDIGAGVEFSDHGEVWGVNLQTPLDEHTDLWGGVHTAEGEHHEDSPHDEHDEHDDSGFFDELSEKLDLGLRLHTDGDKGSLTGGFKKGEAFYKASLNLPFGEKGTVKLTLLAKAGSENQGVFFTTSGKF